MGCGCAKVAALAPRETIRERRLICRACAQCTKSAEARFEAWQGFTTRSSCRVNGANVCGATKCATCRCPEGRWEAVTAGLTEA